MPDAPRGALFEPYFAPYDPSTEAELALIDRVIRARRADDTEYARGENPYKIHMAVYNLRSPGTIAHLIEAVHAGVDVRVLVDYRQIAPDRPWNKVGERFTEAGLTVVHSDEGVPEEARRAAHMVGIESNHLMHLKTRLFSYKDPETGAVVKSVLSGSKNPGDGADFNDENLNLIEDPDVVALYEQKIDDVLMHRRSVNHWDDERGLNVLFTPNRSGARPIAKVFEWIDQEQEAILLSMFDLRDIVDPRSRQTLIQKLKAAQDRGVEVIVITDRKKSDGRDLEGNKIMVYGRYAPNHWVDEDMERAGIPVFEFINEHNEFCAVHSRACIFGLSDIKVVTGAGNWTRASIGSAGKRGKNEESFIFVESSKLDDGRSGRRFLSNFLYLLRHYDHQDPRSSEEMIARLQAKAGWPTVELDAATLVPEGVEGVTLVGNHPLLANGLAVDAGPARVPFGTKLTYDVVGADGAVVARGLERIVMPPGDEPRLPEDV